MILVERHIIKHLTNIGKRLISYPSFLKIYTMQLITSVVNISLLQVKSIVLLTFII